MPNIIWLDALGEDRELPLVVIELGYLGRAEPLDLVPLFLVLVDVGVVGVPILYEARLLGRKLLIRVLFLLRFALFELLSVLSVAARHAAIHQVSHC